MDNQKRGGDYWSIFMMYNEYGKLIGSPRNVKKKKENGGEGKKYSNSSFDAGNEYGGSNTKRNYRSGISERVLRGIFPNTETKVLVKKLLTGISI